MGDRSDYQIVGHNLRNARKAHGLRQAEIAEKLNISANAYGEYERGIKLISTKRLLDFCRILHIKPGEILNGCCYPTDETDELHMIPSEQQELMHMVATFSETKIKQLHLYASFLDTQL